MDQVLANKTGSGALYLERRDSFRILLNEYSISLRLRYKAPDPVFSQNLILATAINVILYTMFYMYTGVYSMQITVVVVEREGG